MTGNYRDCIDTLQAVIGKSTLVPQVEYAYAESLIMTGQISTGIERMQALEKLHPEIPDVHRALGEALNRKGEHSRHLKSFALRSN
jgi:predicted Zn-dependent protease